MAATADNWRQSDILLGAGKLYCNVAVPADGARILMTTGTPDTTTSAVHVGITKAGSKLTVSGNFSEYRADEFPDPLITDLEQTEMMLEAELGGVLNTTLLEYLTPAYGTHATAAGYSQLTIGRKALTYQGVVIVAPRADNPAMTVIAHIYKAINTAGISLNFGRTEQGWTPVNFKGYAITSRTATDTLGNVWYQI